VVERRVEHPEEKAPKKEVPVQGRCVQDLRLLLAEAVRHGLEGAPGRRVAHIPSTPTQREKEREGT